MKRRSAYRRKVKIRVAFRMNTFGSRTGQREKMSWYVKSGPMGRTDVVTLLWNCFALEGRVRL